MKSKEGEHDILEEQIRINKYLSLCGYCSRREADRLVEEGKVTIDGSPASNGDRVMMNQLVCVEGQVVKKEEDETILIAFHKPKGIVCTSSKEDKDNIIDYIGYPKRIFPVGRLDKESTGLILLTNDGELTDRILRGRNGHEKEYVVRVNKPLRSEIIKAMEQGVPILDRITKPCQIHLVDSTTFRIILTQGLNRQIRRMCEYFGYRVTNLQRIRIMNIRLADLPVGKWRNLTKKEMKDLEQSLKGQKFYNE